MAHSGPDCECTAEAGLRSQVVGMRLVCDGECFLQTWQQMKQLWCTIAKAWDPYLLFTLESGPEFSLAEMAHIWKELACSAVPVP